MKVILSRKGFDSANGGIVSPILEDGAMISFPIPSPDANTFFELEYNGIPYAQLLHDLKYKERPLRLSLPHRPRPEFHTLKGETCWLVSSLWTNGCRRILSKKYRHRSRRYFPVLRKFSLHHKRAERYISLHPTHRRFLSGQRFAGHLGISPSRRDSFHPRGAKGHFVASTFHSFPNLQPDKCNFQGKWTALLRSLSARCRDFTVRQKACADAAGCFQSHLEEKSRLRCGQHSEQSKEQFQRPTDRYLLRRHLAGTCSERIGCLHQLVQKDASVKRKNPSFRCCLGTWERGIFTSGLLY